MLSINWNGQTDKRTDGKDHELSQADALTKKEINIQIRKEARKQVKSK